ncbi:MAG: hypothetical protein KZQ83_06990, partial [gamma proteobacterium symbiont of Taylorina sp.]|nr:hypothetical protein [gamma proteobacterium symbiont of Taylorina sp.]
FMLTSSSLIFLPLLYTIIAFLIFFLLLFIIYLATDGFLDQNGGKKGFPFGNKRFKKLLLEINHETMADQKQNERNDDITVIGVKI